MGLTTIDAKLAAAFSGPLSRAVEEFTATREMAGEYDPVTGSTTTTLTYTGRGVFAGYRAELVDEQHILGTDVELTALQNETTETPQVDDTINGMTVVRVQQDPAAVTWVLQLRVT
ncbi:hypothetical protein [uncultured Halomonas sp.]|uniref:hypothetical protein n=1 Tax=uncultured Halomonas sp. TaxID=173971 RepID=UPI00261E4594|nr:hypothetical protein [uncultured Halomonas sp.]